MPGNGDVEEETLNSCHFALGTIVVLDLVEYQVTYFVPRVIGSTGVKMVWRRCASPSPMPSPINVAGVLVCFLK